MADTEGESSQVLRISSADKENLVNYEPCQKKAKLSDPSNDFTNRLEDRLTGILCCAVCLDLPQTCYQCTNGHLMCAACFNHLLADARIRDETATCPNCRCEINKSNCVRNLAVEKASSEMPVDCHLCSLWLPRHQLSNHQRHLCPERPTVCRYARIGCRWKGPHQALGEHEASCVLPSKSGIEIMDALEAFDAKQGEEQKLYKTVFSLLSFEKITFNGMKCGRNKAICMTKEMSALHMLNLSQQMRRGPFSIATDGSNEKDKKRFPLVVHIEGQDSVNSELLAMLQCDGSATGENIFQLIDKEFSAQQIPWRNCVSFGCDNANVMTGWRKGVIVFVRTKQVDIHLSGCTLHLVHIAARNGAEGLLPVDEILVDMFYYFQKNVNRQNDLKGLQSLYDVEQLKVLKHVNTCWLSIGRCLVQLLNSWDPLRHFFLEEKEKTNSSSYAKKKVEGIADFLRLPINCLLCHFLSYTIKVFDKVLLQLQAEEPMVHRLYSVLRGLLRDLYSSSSHQQVCIIIDLQLKPFRTDDFITQLFYESCRFSAFGFQWTIRASLNYSECKNPSHSSRRTMQYQLSLKTASPANPIHLHFLVLKGPYGEMKMNPVIYEHEFSGKDMDSGFKELPLADTSECNKILAMKTISLRAILFQVVG